MFGYSRISSKKKRVIGIGLEECFQYLYIGAPRVTLSLQNKHQNESRLYEKDPTKTVSVTSLVKSFVPIEYLQGDDNKKKRGSGAPKQSSIGNRVHLLIKRYLDSIMDEDVNRKYPGLSLERNYYYAFKKFNTVMKNEGYEPYRTEMEIIDGKFKVSGDVDAIYSKKIDNDNDMIIIDWKCTEKAIEELRAPYRLKIDVLDDQEKKNIQMGIFQNKDLGQISTLTQYKLQLSLYALILQKEYSFKVSKIYLVFLRKDETYDLLEVDNVALATAVKILNYRKNKIIKLGQELESTNLNLQLEKNDNLNLKLPENGINHPIIIKELSDDENSDQDEYVPEEKNNNEEDIPLTDDEDEETFDQQGQLPENVTDKNQRFKLKDTLTYGPKITRPVLLGRTRAENASLRREKEREEIRQTSNRRRTGPNNKRKRTKK